MTHTHTMLALNDMSLDEPGLRLNNLFQPIKPLLQFFSVPSPKARLLPFLILAQLAIASAPSTTWLGPVTFDFPLLAEFA